MQLKQVIHEWAAVHAQKTKKNTNDYIVRMLNRNYGHLFDQKCNEIRPNEILEATQQNSISSYDAKRSISAITAVFDYACILDIIQNNPAARLTKFIPAHRSVNSGLPK